MREVLVLEPRAVSQFRPAGKTSVALSGGNPVSANAACTAESCTHTNSHLESFGAFDMRTCLQLLYGRGEIYPDTVLDEGLRFVEVTVSAGRRTIVGLYNCRGGLASGA